jgi:pyroglutamyl-peptidase
MTAAQDILLLTGFEPFGRWEINPSWEIARSLNGETIGGAKLVSRQLPVAWERAWPALEQAIAEARPKWVLMLGQAARRAHISVECRGLNTCNEDLDNTGKGASAAMIVTDGDEELQCTLPVDGIIRRIEELGLPVQRSDRAGAYLCNYALYRALVWSRGREEAPAIGFIHVPNLPSMDPEIAGMALDDQLNAVRAAISAIVNDRLEEPVGSVSTRPYPEPAKGVLPLPRGGVS